MVLDKLVAESFAGNDQLKSAMREGFESLLNSDLSPDTSARFVATFVHKTMQKEDAHSKSKEVMMLIKAAKYEIIVSIFRYLRSKDTFENFYTKFLSERLLKKRSESHDKELEFVVCIKAECG